MPALEPTEVLTAQEAEDALEERAESRAFRQPAAVLQSTVKVSLAAAGGELLARLLGARPGVGRALGAAAARLTDPKVQKQLGELSARIKSARRPR